jgi:hypothetical protein
MHLRPEGARVMTAARPTPPSRARSPRTCSTLRRPSATSQMSEIRFVHRRIDGHGGLTAVLGMAAAQGGEAFDGPGAPKISPVHQASVEESLASAKGFDNRPAR